MKTKTDEQGRAEGCAEPMELRGIAEALENGDGFWRSCTGCHELNEGHDTGPYSETLKCHLGSGCSECGGVGAIWDAIDYQAMADDMASDMAASLAEQPDKKFLNAVLDLCNNYGGPTAGDCKGEYAWVGDIWRTAEAMLRAAPQLAAPVVKDDEYAKA